MDFKAFSDQLLAANIDTQDIAEALGVTRNTVLRWRMDGSSPNARHAPAGWEQPLRALAKSRAVHLSDLADSLEP